MESISPVALKARLDAGEKPFLLDVRESWEYALCSIEGSRNISQSNIEKIQQDLKPDDDIVVICHHGLRSLQVANYLIGLGFNKISNLEGGVDAWARTVDANMAQY